MRACPTRCLPSGLATSTRPLFHKFVVAAFDEKHQVRKLLYTLFTVRSPVEWYPFWRLCCSPSVIPLNVFWKFWMAWFLATQAFCSGPLRARLKLIASRAFVSRRPQDSFKEFWNPAQVDPHGHVNAHVLSWGVRILRLRGALYVSALRAPWPQVHTPF